MMTIRAILKQPIIWCVDFFASLRGFHFPPSFLWYWKLDYLLMRYERETTAYFKKTIRPGMTVIDVGANLGYYTRMFSKLVGPQGHVFAFEPDEENWNYLVKNVSGLSNIRIFKMAVTDTEGVTDFYHEIGMTGTHTTLPIAHAEKRTAHATSLDAFVDSEHIEQVDVIKIDVEGAEPNVFRGMEDVLKQKPIVVFEYTPSVAHEFLDALKEHHSLFALTQNGKLQSLDRITFTMGKREFANVVLKDE